MPRWPAEQILFRAFLLTGFRKGEIRFLTWADLDWKRFTIKVTPKPEYDFVIKDHEDRTVPVPPWDVKSLEVTRIFWEQTYNRNTGYNSSHKYKGAAGFGEKTKGA